MIMEDQFGVGDVIDTGQAVGTVEDFGLRLTRLRDDNGVVWYVPNGAIQRVGNRSQGWGLATVDVPLAKTEDLEQALRLVKETVDAVITEKSHADDVLDTPPAVTVESITPFGVTLRGHRPDAGPAQRGGRPGAACPDPRRLRQRGDRQPRPESGSCGDCRRRAVQPRLTHT